MRDIWQTQLQWVDFNKPFVLARVVKTWKSAPRKTGAGMMVFLDEKSDSIPEVVGSVSGGCIEGAVIEEAMEVLKTGSPQLLNFGVEDELALSVGLSCGGEVSVLVEKHWAFSSQKKTRQVWFSLKECLQKNQPAVLVTSLDFENRNEEAEPPLLVIPEKENVGGFEKHRNQLISSAQDALKNNENRIEKIAGKTVFIQVFPRQDELLIIGAGHITIPLVALAKELDFRTTVIDPREVFLKKERFPVIPDQMIHGWPQDVLPDFPLHENSYTLLLTHDPKIDDPALHIFLKMELPYIGALGSKRTHAKRCDRLREAGFTEDEIAKIKGPAGVDIGSQTASEIALSMLAEVVATKRGKLK